MNKKKMIVIKFLFLIICPIIEAWAHELKEPYMYTQAINQEPIDKDTCLEILTRPRILEANAQSNGEILSNEIDSVEEEYQKTVDEIEELSANKTGLIPKAYDQYNYTVEVIYKYYAENDSHFQNSNEEEKLLIIENDESVKQWQDYIDELENSLNQLYSKLAELEEKHDQLVYEYNQLSSQTAFELSDTPQENDSRIYPYSTDKMEVNNILLNDQTDLTGFLSQIDKYMKDLVPRSYSDLSFSEIHSIFSKNLTDESLNQALANKLTVEVDDKIYQEYSYAKTLDRSVVSKLSEYGLIQYSKDNNYDSYHSQYQKVLDIKEDQLKYFYEINQGAFSLLKDRLAKYLNNNALYDENSINKVKEFHDKYQVRLVYFSDGQTSGQGTWHTNDPFTSGYLDRYYDLSLQNKLDEESISNENLQELDELSEESSGSIESDDEEFERLRNKLNEKRKEKESKKPDLPSPSSLNKDKKGEEAGKTSGNIKLPTTGEQAPYTIAAIVLLIIGLILLLVNLRMKRKSKEKNDSIDLD